VSPRRPAPLPEDADVPEPVVDENGYSRPSKSQLKREMTELQELGEALLELPPKRVADLDLGDRLHDAITAARRITAHEGRRRQLQLLGKLMRGIDPAPIREAVTAFRLGHARNALALHQVEAWRSELIASDDAITRWMREQPDSDVQQLRQLVRTARRDVQADAGAGQTQRQQRAYRELFQWLRAVIEAAPGVEPAHERDDHDDEFND
jgi:ribosome-associated protein